ncbi:DUF3800 domain-containing protein [Candidatus Gracilibacteria bacterium]|nr:DUF3800 domain-containing protein [Candidatus Gracilibacteria bacterium]
MIIYLDESKRLGKGLIVIGGFISCHNTGYIEKFIENKKVDFDIPKKVELKSIDKYGKIFMEKLKEDNDFSSLDIYSFGFCFSSYFFDSQEMYTNLLIKVLSEVYNLCPYKQRKSTIVHDNVNAKNHEFITKKIEQYLKDKLDIKAKVEIHNSKKFLSLQLADLLVSKYKELYFFDEVNELDDMVLYKNLIHKKI